MSTEELLEKYPYVACEYSRALALKSPGFALQVNPDPRGLEDEGEWGPDPFGEEDESAGCYGLKQRFPDRVLIMASDSCFMNCRHCTRKGILRRAEVVRTDEELQTCLSYVQDHPQVRDVLISGGDPLVLPDDEVMRFVRAFADMEQIDVIRVCTRAPCVNPSRVTRELAARLGRSGKVWVNTQFNCAEEVTPEATEACTNLVRAGIPVSCQTVLLAGVNDSTEKMLALFRALQRARVRPYYVFQCAPIAGVSRVRVPVARALAIGSASFFGRIFATSASTPAWCQASSVTRRPSFASRTRIPFFSHWASSTPTMSVKRSGFPPVRDPFICVSSHSSVRFQFNPTSPAMRHAASAQIPANWCCRAISSGQCGGMSLRFSFSCSRLSSGCAARAAATVVPVRRSHAAFSAGHWMEPS